jgi:hypothetical protein
VTVFGQASLFFANNCFFQVTVLAKQLFHPNDRFIRVAILGVAEQPFYPNYRFIQVTI